MDKNRKRAAIWGGGALVVILIISWSIYQAGQKEVRASQALAEVDLPMPPGKLPSPGTAEKLLQVEKDFPNTQAAARALLEAAGMRFMESNYAAAEALFSRFEQDYPESPWLPQAMLGRAKTLEVENKDAEALAAYEQLRKLYPSGAIADDVKLGLARLYEKTDKPSDALKIYQEILSAQYAAYTGIGAQASARQEALLKKYPDLMKTNTPTVTPATLNKFLNATNLVKGTNLLQATNLLKATNLPVKLPSTQAVTTPLSNLIQKAKSAAKVTASNTLKTTKTNLNLDLKSLKPTLIPKPPAPTPAPAEKK